MKWLLLLVVTLLAVLVGYRVRDVINRPMPANLERPQTVRWLDEVGRLAHTADRLLDSVGVDAASSPLKTVVNWAASLLVSPPAWLLSRKPSTVQVTETMYAGVRVLVYVPPEKTSKPRPAMVYFHGGGWTWFSVDTFDYTLEFLARKLDYMIIAPDYRTAPQHPFPVPYADCLAVTSYVLKHAKELGADGRKVMVAGEGSGGNLAAAVAHALKGKLALQLLITPALQPLNFATPSYQDNANVLPGITSPEREARQWLRYAKAPLEHEKSVVQNLHISPELYKQYRAFLDSKRRVPSYMNVTKRVTLHHSATSHRVAADLDRFIQDQRFSPMLVKNVTGVPSAYVITAQYDVLRDEAIMYAHRLHEQEVKVKLRHYDQAYHGFFSLVGNTALRSPVSVKAANDLADFLRFHFGVKATR